MSGHVFDDSRKSNFLEYFTSSIYNKFLLLQENFHACGSPSTKGRAMKTQNSIYPQRVFGKVSWFIRNLWHKVRERELKIVKNMAILHGKYDWAWSFYGSGICEEVTSEKTWLFRVKFRSWSFWNFNDFLIFKS